MMLYPLKFIPVYKNMIWGGNRLQSYFSRKIPGEKIGESWELCCRDDGMSVVKNGRLQGKTIQELIDTYKEKLVGTEIYQKYGKNFPLLIKLIDANDRLSVQVHPDDNYATANGEKFGKDEMWYVIDAKEDAKLIYGLNSKSPKSKVEKVILDGRISQLLNEVIVKPGDFIPIPAGTVHALLSGLLVAEIQQNSNTTYRIYDWNRTDDKGNRRPLHIQQALDVIRFDAEFPDELNFQKRKREGRGIIRYGSIIKEFQVDELILGGALSRKSTPESFQVIMNLKGYGKLMYFGGCVDLYPGDTILIPASLGDYCVFGNMKLLVTYKKGLQNAEGMVRYESL